MTGTVFEVKNIFEYNSYSKLELSKSNQSRNFSFIDELIT